MHETCLDLFYHLSIITCHKVLKQPFKVWHTFFMDVPDYMCHSMRQMLLRIYYALNAIMAALLMNKLVH